MGHYLLLHRDIPNLDPGFYTPLFLSNHETSVELKVRDYFPKFADFNLYLNELVGFYYVWKIDKGDVKSCIQYRMRPNMSYKDIMGTLDKYTFISHNDYVGNLGGQFCHFHSPNHKIWNMLVQLLKDMKIATDEQLTTWANSEWLYSRNTLIAKAKDFDDYCAWLFPIMEEFTKRMGFNTIDDVMAWAEKDQSFGGPKDRARLAGYLSERLMTLYFLIKFGSFEEVKNKVYIPEYTWKNKIDLN